MRDLTICLKWGGKAYRMTEEPLCEPWIYLAFLLWVRGKVEGTFPRLPCSRQEKGKSNRSIRIFTAQGDNALLLARDDCPYH